MIIAISVPPESVINRVGCEIPPLRGEPTLLNMNTLEQGDNSSREQADASNRRIYVKLFPSLIGAENYVFPSYASSRLFYDLEFEIK